MLSQQLHLVYNTKAIVWWFLGTAIFLLTSLPGSRASNKCTHTPGEIQGVFAGARWLCLTFWSSAPRWGPSRCQSESLHTPTSRHREIRAVEWQLARANPLCGHSGSGGGQYSTHTGHNAGYPISQNSSLSPLQTWHVNVKFIHCYSYYSLAII